MALGQNPQSSPNTAPQMRKTPLQNRKELLEQIKNTNVDIDSFSDTTADFDEFSKLKKEQISLINYYKLSINQEIANVSANDWDLMSKKGLEDIFIDIKLLGIDTGNKIFESAFSVLNSALDPEKNSYLKDPKLKNLFSDPFSNITRIEALADIDDFSPKKYAESIRMIIELQATILANAESRESIQKKSGVAAVQDEVSNISGQYFDKINDAWNSGNKGAAIAYVLAGLTGAFLGKKMMFDWLAKGGKNKKMVGLLGLLGIGGAGAYFLGNDVNEGLKSAGVYYEVFDDPNSSFSCFKNSIESSANPAISSLNEDLDYGVLFKMEEINLMDLHRLSQQDNGTSIISPKNFPSVFTEFAGVEDINLSKGIRGIDDYEKNDSFASAKHRQLVKVGKQIYKFAKLISFSYRDTIQKYDPNYKGKTFEEFMSDNLMGNVHNYMDALRANYKHVAFEKQKKANNLKEELKGYASIDDIEIIEHLYKDIYFARISGAPVLIEAKFDSDGGVSSIAVFPVLGDKTATLKEVNDKSINPGLVLDVGSEIDFDDLAKLYKEHVLSFVTIVTGDDKVTINDLNFVYEDGKFILKFVEAKGTPTEEEVGFVVNFDANGNPLFGKRAETSLVLGETAVAAHDFEALSLAKNKLSLILYDYKATIKSDFTVPGAAGIAITKPFKEPDCFENFKEYLLDSAFDDLLSEYQDKITLDPVNNEGVEQNFKSALGLKFAKIFDEEKQRPKYLDEYIETLDDDDYVLDPSIKIDHLRGVDKEKKLYKSLLKSYYTLYLEAAYTAYTGRPHHIVNDATLEWEYNELKTAESRVATAILVRDMVPRSPF